MNGKWDNHFIRMAKPGRGTKFYNPRKTVTKTSGKTVEVGHNNSAVPTDIVIKDTSSPVKKEDPVPISTVSESQEAVNRARDMMKESKIPTRVTKTPKKRGRPKNVSSIFNCDIIC